MKNKKKISYSKILPLKVESIFCPTMNFDEPYSHEELDIMVKKIQSDDKIEPIIVGLSSDGYRLIKGRIIFDAYRLLQRKIIYAVIQR